MRLCYLLFLVLFFMKATVGEIPVDLLLCLEKGECGVVSIGAFSIKNPNGEGPSTDLTHNSMQKKNQTDVSKEETALSASEESGTEKDPYINGYIFALKNGLPYDITYYWDIMGNFFGSNSDNDGMSKNIKKTHHATQSHPNGLENNIDNLRSTFVPSNTIRYIDSGIYETHTLRLFVKIVRHTENQQSYDDDTNKAKEASSDQEEERQKSGEILMEEGAKFYFESIDKAVGLFERKCGSGLVDKVCNYLFRICYNHYTIDSKRYNSGKGSSLTAEKTLNKLMNNCEDYQGVCDGFSVKTEGQQCIETCTATHFSQFLNEQESESFVFDPRIYLKCAIDNQHFQQKLKGKSLKTDWKTIAKFDFYSPRGSSNLDDYILSADSVPPTTCPDTTALTNAVIAGWVLFGVAIIVIVILMFLLIKSKTDVTYQISSLIGLRNNGSEGKSHVRNINPDKQNFL